MDLLPNSCDSQVWANAQVTKNFILVPHLDGWGQVLWAIICPLRCVNMAQKWSSQASNGHFYIRSLCYKRWLNLLHHDAGSKGNIFKAII